MALKLRKSSEYFEDWADEHFKKKPPPWDSSEGDNYDNDDEQCIRVMPRSAYDAELASNTALLSKAAASAAKAAGKAKKQKQAALAKSGRVHYSFPGPPRGVDSPASVEAVIGKDGAAYAVPRGQALSIAGGKHPVITSAELAACRDLMVHGGLTMASLGRGGDSAAALKDDPATGAGWRLCSRLAHRSRSCTGTTRRRSPSCSTAVWTARRRRVGAARDAPDQDAQGALIPLLPQLCPRGPGGSGEVSALERLIFGTR